MKRSILYIFCVIAVMTSCVEESFNQPNAPVDADVNFTARVSKGPATRTVYGDIEGNMQNVYWVHGDKISVFGAECGISQAEYSVGTVNVDDTNTPILDDNGNETPVANQNYANYLTKTGSAGVQWGNVAQTDFYAVYPSTGNSFTANGVSESTSTATDGSIVNIVTTTSATVKTNISTEQTVKFLLADNAASGATKKMWKGVHYGDNVATPSAPSALMYACTPDAIATDEDGNAKTIDLQFQPFSTILRFKFDGFHIIDGENTNAEYTSTVYVTEITLTAPSGVGVAGDFDLTINKDKTASAGNGTSNVISIIPSVQIPLESDQALEFDVFAIPQNYTMSDEQIWSVTIKTTGGDHTYKMIPKIVNEENETSTEVTLTAGKIHNLGIPTKTVETIGVQVPDSEWIEYIPRNVYLSELSMPGAWYAGDLAAYQGKATLAQLYESGVRAFHFDCRMSPSSFSVDISLNKTYGPLELVCAGTDKWDAGGPGAASILYNPFTRGTSVESQLQILADQIKDITEEYVMVILTIAERPLNSSGTVYGGATTNPNTVLSAISSMLEANGKNWKVFGYRDEDRLCDADGNLIKDANNNYVYKTINANTTVNDVLGSMIVKVNVNVDQDVKTGEDGTVTSGTSLSSFNMSNVLLSEGSMATDSDYTATGNATTYPGVVLGSFTDMNEATMYWGSSLTDPLMKYYYHHAQLTEGDTESSSGTSTPSLYDRESAVLKIINQSADIYANNLHNALFQVGIGGYVKHGSGLVAYNSQAEVSAHLNTVVLNAVNAKLQTAPSPIGIVLMNYVYYDSINPSENGGSSSDDALYETNGKKLTKAIIEMNKKFFLNRNPEAEEWPDGNPFDQTGTSNAQQLSVAHINVTEEAL